LSKCDVVFSLLCVEGSFPTNTAAVENNWCTQLQGFAELLQHCIRAQSSVTALYGSFSALNLPYKEVTEL